MTTRRIVKAALLALACCCVFVAASPRKQGGDPPRTLEECTAACASWAHVESHGCDASSGTVTGGYGECYWYFNYIQMQGECLTLHDCTLVIPYGTFTVAPGAELKVDYDNNGTYEGSIYINNTGQPQTKTISLPAVDDCGVTRQAGFAILNGDPPAIVCYGKIKGGCSSCN